jgi:predicted nucleic acid-binding protein
VLIDTNVWSELVKPRPDPKVAAWIVEHFDRCILSTLVLGEMRYGIAHAEGSPLAARLQAFHDDLLFRIADRLLPFDAEAATAWAILRARLRRAGTLVADMDLLIAAQAIAAGVPLVTRNVRDMERTGAEIINPWAS